jgi:hypothetical protein
MITFSICPACSNHIRDDEACCPFCGEVRATPALAPSKRTRLAVVTAKVISVLSIAACGYGLPPTLPDASVDAHHATDAHAADAHVDAH